jgi:spermidine/putrescine-binding protein
MDLCLGELRMDKEVVLRMTWGNLWRVIYGYWIGQEREWDRTRTLMAVIINKNRSRKQPYKPPHRIMPLAIDKMGKDKLEWDEEKFQKFEAAQKSWGLNKK